MLAGLAALASNAHDAVILPRSTQAWVWSQESMARSLAFIAMMNTADASLDA